MALYSTAPQNSIKTRTLSKVGSSFYNKAIGSEERSESVVNIRQDPAVK